MKVAKSFPCGARASAIPRRPARARSGYVWENTLWAMAKSKSIPKALMEKSSTKRKVGRLILTLSGRRSLHRDRHRPDYARRGARTRRENYPRAAYHGSTKRL